MKATLWRPLWQGRRPSAREPDAALVATSETPPNRLACPQDKVIDNDGGQMDYNTRGAVSFLLCMLSFGLYLAANDGVYTR